MAREILLAAAIFVAFAIASVATWPPESGGSHGKLLEGASIPDHVRSSFERACSDCHSQGTKYPWYSFVAPASWLIRRDVVHGREHLNFSSWHQYSINRRERLLSEIANQVRDGDMPLSSYKWLHPTARLSESEINAIFNWTQNERTRLISEQYGGIQENSSSH